MKLESIHWVDWTRVTNAFMGTSESLLFSVNPQPSTSKSFSVWLWMWRSGYSGRHMGRIKSVNWTGCLSRINAMSYLKSPLPPMKLGWTIVSSTGMSCGSSRHTRSPPNHTQSLGLVMLCSPKRTDALGKRYFAFYRYNWVIISVLTGYRVYSALPSKYSLFKK